MLSQIERMDDRLDAIQAALIAWYLTQPEPERRVVKRGLVDYREHSDAELASGVVTLVSEGEDGFSTRFGEVGRKGQQGILLVGHLKVAETATPAAVEALELDMVEQLKTFVRGGVTRIGLLLNTVQQSRQLDHPYGWFVMSITAGPPLETIR
jgi:hypothetical protein